MNHYAYLPILIAIVVLPGASLASVEANNADSDTVSTQIIENTEISNIPVVPGRGQLLYENHCIQCHDSVAHRRQHNKTKSISDIRQWVQLWSKNLELGWTGHDIDMVTDFLNQRYYHLTTEK